VTRSGSGPAPGLVVVLDGPSSVGKTTVLELLQDRWADLRSRPLLEAGLDRTLWSIGQPALMRWWPLIQQYGPHGADPPTQVGWGPLGRELTASMHRAAATWAADGWDVAMDHVLLDGATVADLRDALAGLTVVHVGLTCDEDELARREAERDDRTLGQAVVQARVTREVCRRDLVLDTTAATPQETTSALVAHVRTVLGSG
jgi:chloramphenicol 3-O phosphotransferase